MVALCAQSLASPAATRSERLLRDGWRFHLGDVTEAATPQFDDSKWQRVSIPHDWAIAGPFCETLDLQNVAVTQNGEKQASLKTGRTGGLPYVGVGWYRTTFAADTSDGRRTTLVFDGAMSEAHVYVNGQEAIFWPCGYNSFHVDVTDLLTVGTNTLAVRLENHPESSRWYPGAGLFRNVHLVETGRVHVGVWGTYVTTQVVGDPTEPTEARVTLQTEVMGAEGQTLRLVTRILDDEGNEVAMRENRQKVNHGAPLTQHLLIPEPQLWSPETPYLYHAVTEVMGDSILLDTYTTTFGVRTIEVVPDKGFLLNGEVRKFRGVCNHHDLGPLGAAINRAALRHQIALLQDMGCDAIRTSHNMPAPDLVELCDSMGMMMMVEPFDEWDVAKCRNGYHRFFGEWAERDMENMVRHYRNNASVVMWSIGNEVPSQGSKSGWKTAAWLQDICHRLDPTRPVTCGMDQVARVLDNGFAAVLDVPGFNYRTQYYEQGYERLPQGFVLGSETASTVSSRGVYKLPAQLKAGATYDDHQSSSYDLEACWWSNTPDEDFALAEDFPWTMGQFVWTGFDYLGEPTPYDANAWPSHSSLFGIIDLASLPKDRYYLYRSIWNTDAPTLHILPHWTWPGKEGQTVPVFVYTDADEAELFVNGKSQGRQHKATKAESDSLREAGDPLWLQRRYRLMWTDVIYEPGTLSVITPDGRSASMRTAGIPHHLVLEPDRRVIQADGEDLCYVTVSVVDKDGNVCPNDNSLVRFAVKGAGSFRAAAAGDPTSLEVFHQPQHHAFSGRLTCILQSSTQAGKITLTATAKGLKRGILTVETKKGIGLSPTPPPKGGAKDGSNGSNGLNGSNGQSQEQWLSIQEMLTHARTHIGTRYRRGGTTPAGFDCSGFTTYLYKRLGYKLHRSSRDQFLDGTLVTGALQPGDLVFFARGKKQNRIHHVGILTQVNADGTFDFIHSSTSNGIRIDNSAQAYYASRYCGARRVISN